MEHTLNLAKAKEVSAYIKAIYGEKELGIFRLLASIPYFRRAVVRGKLQELLGMSLISFEKYLREEHHILYRYAGTTFNVERVVGGSTRILKGYTDDVLFSVAGAVVGQIRDLYPDADPLSSVPLVSLGRGGSVDNVLDHVDIPSICAFVRKLPESYIDETVADIIYNYGAMVSDKRLDEITAVMRYKIVDALHKLYVQLRVQPVEVKDVITLPACEKQDFMDVVMGIKAASVIPEAGGKIPKVLLAALAEAWPEGEEREGAFYLTGEAILDPFKYIGSSVVDVSLPDFAALPPVEHTVAPTSSPNAAEGGLKPVSEVGPGFASAVDLVLQYADTNINELSPGEKEVALYGFVGGHDVFLKMSNAAQKNLTKLVPIGDYEAQTVIAKLATALRQNLKHRVQGVTEEQYALMAAGRIVAWKGNWIIEPDGIWRKIK